MRLKAKNLAGVATLMLCSCAVKGEDKPATEMSTQQPTTTTSQQTPAPSNSATPMSETAQQTPAPSESTTTQNTSTTSATAPDESMTGTAAAPVQSSTTTTTTSTTEAANSSDAAATPAAATAADVKKGSSVYDKNGDLIGKINSVSGKNAVVSTGKVKVTVELTSFAKNDKGLVLVMTKAEIEAAAKSAKPK